MRYTITEDGEEVGHVTDDGGEYDYRYTGDRPFIERSLGEIRFDEDIETDYGPAGATAETWTEADPGEKLRTALDLLEGRPGMGAEPDAASGAVDKLSALWDEVSGG